MEMNKNHENMDVGFEPCGWVLDRVCVLLCWGNELMVVSMFVCCCSV